MVSYIARLLTANLALLLSVAGATPALDLQRKTLLENPGAAYMLISFPSEEYDLSIEMTDDGAGAVVGFVVLVVCSCVGFSSVKDRCV